MCIRDRNSFPPKSGGDLGAAVDSGDGHILLEAAKLQGLLDDRREVFAAVNMDDARIGHQCGGKYPVRVRGLDVYKRQHLPLPMLRQGK